ncbi:hypothetical protein [Myceligenerans pegani]|uniref:Uncharacterized protein n=1 Tax=Myceligenerans pegani TaxID=2776917 RepID=A0ABR9N0G1_9MICO|nr:hypothetical protein [Myceligenerans sp. TRM 65318]MBE1877139.1 hypothetical protein [Myceligenerans sp. TRM 65318]MBE3019410.1 hypothetical protein [Myceligenerans sp. TRM 65318]
MTHVLTLTPEEAIALVRPRPTLPSFVTDLACDNDTVSLTADLRRLVHAPMPVKLAARAVPTMHGSARIVSVADNVAVLAVDADAAGLPATKLLPLASGTVAKMARKKGLPEGTVEVRKDATIALNMQALLADRFSSVTGLTFSGGKVVVTGTPA